MAASLLRRACILPLRIFAFPNGNKQHVINRCYRQIKVTEDDKTTTIEGFIFEDDNSQFVPPENLEDTCPIRSRGILVNYEDVLILQQFITSTGEMLPQSVTGLCLREHYKVTAAVKMAQRADLLPGSEEQIDERGNEIPKLNRYLTRYPIGSRNPIKKRGPYWKKYHYKIGDAKLSRDAPRVSLRRLKDSH